MPYQHYGNIGDIWKHLPLCEILAIERPRIYVETNAAHATYRLEGTPCQQYGVGHVYRRGAESDVMAESRYFKLLREVNANAPLPHTYLGSPALAMQVLQDVAERFIFFDIEAPALASDASYARNLGLHERVETVLGDSISGAYRLLDDLSREAFIHIDPYTIFDPNAEGLTYFDVFLKAAQRGLKAMLWYGYFTSTEQRAIHERFSQALSAEADIDPGKLYGADVWLDVIQPDAIVVNPGIVGCGVLTANLSPALRDVVAAQSDALVDLYANGVTFEGDSGRLQSTRLTLSH